MENKQNICPKCGSYNFFQLSITPQKMRELSDKITRIVIDVIEKEYKLEGVPDNFSFSDFIICLDKIKDFDFYIDFMLIKFKKSFSKIIEGCLNNE